MDAGDPICEDAFEFAGSRGWEVTLNCLMYRKLKFAQASIELNSLLQEPRGHLCIVPALSFGEECAQIALTTLEIAAF
jgi:hypothetical protein